MDNFGVRIIPSTNPTPRLNTTFEDCKFEDKFLNKGRMMDIQPHTPHNPYNSRREILKVPKMVTDSGHHRLAVVATTTRGEGHFLPGFYPFDFINLWINNC